MDELLNEKRTGAKMKASSSKRFLQFCTHICLFPINLEILRCFELRPKSFRNAYMATCRTDRHTPNERPRHEGFLRLCHGVIGPIPLLSQVTIVVWYAV